MSPTVVKCQTTPGNFTERIRYLIQLNYKPNNGALADSCINSIVYLKFKIENEQVDSVDISINTPALIKVALLKAILTINKQLKLTNAEIQQAKLKTFLLPVILNYQSGCTPSSTLTLEMLEKSNMLNKLNPTTSMRNALINMLKFEKGGAYPVLECIIINPINFGSYF